VERVFRSLLNIQKDGKSTIPQEELVRNYKAFLTSRVKPEQPSYITLYHWIEAHYRAYNELPSIELMYEKAAANGNDTLLSNLQDVAKQLPYVRSDFAAILHEKFEAQNLQDYQSVLSRSWQIASQGMKHNKKELKGMKDSFEYLAAETRRLRMATTGIKTDSQILSDDDRKEVIEGYETRRRNPMAGMGLFTFLDKIDETFRGVKPGDLFIIAAYTSQCKSTMAVNMTYNGISQGLNGMFVPLEKNFAQTRDVFYMMHTSYWDWLDSKEFKHLVGKVSFEKFRYGELNEEQYKFFKASSDDFARRATLKDEKERFGELKLFQPIEKLTPSRLEMEVMDYQAELARRGKQLDFLVIDYVSLMVQDKNERYGDFNVDLNNIITRLKTFGLTFDNGRGLRVITPFQVNREGWKEAVKAEGIYQLTAMSNANEAERSADGVISLFMDNEMRKTGRLKIGCLKDRDGSYFPPFEAQVDYTTMRIRDVLQKRTSSPIEDIDIDMGSIPLDS